MSEPVPENVHSADYFGESRDYWWHPDFVALLAARWQVDSVGDVLDVGSGLGHWSRALLPALPKEARLTGIEREPASVSEAAQRAARRGLGERMDFRVGLAEALPVDDASFDMVTCQTLLIHVPDPSIVLREMWRVLRPGGLLAVIEPVNLASGPAFEARALGAPVDTVLRLFELHLRCEEGKRLLGEGDNSLGERLPGLVQSAGFTELQVHQTDRAWSMFPPYQAPHERAAITEMRSAFEAGHATWRKADAKRYFDAGGGDDFEAAWSETLAHGRRLQAALEAGTYALAGGYIGITIAARKPHTSRAA